MTRRRGRVVLTAVVLALLAPLFLLVAIRRPPWPYMDEILYVPVARALLHGVLPHLPSEIPPGWHHPPLGSYLISFGMALAGDNSLGWRLSATLFGALTLAGIFLWVYLLLRDYSSALTATALTACNGFWFVMSRVAMLDVFFFAFSIWGVVGVTAALRSEVSPGWRRCCLLFSGVIFGLSLACKWNAVVTAAVMVLMVCALFLLAEPARARSAELSAVAQRVRQLGWPAVLLGLIALPIIIYLVPIAAELRAAHCALSFQRIVDLHLAILRTSRSFPGSLLLRAPWYTWPLRTRPLPGLSYLLGNYVVMWGGLVALGVCAWRLRRGVWLPELMVVLLYAANLLQWAVTPIKTPIYYYYYPAAMLLGPAIAIALHGAARQRLWGVRISFIVVTAAALFFLYWYPRMANLETPWECIFGC